MREPWPDLREISIPTAPSLDADAVPRDAIAREIGPVGAWVDFRRTDRRSVHRAKAEAGDSTSRSKAYRSRGASEVATGELDHDVVGEIYRFAGYLRRQATAHRGVLVPKADALGHSWHSGGCPALSRAWLSAGSRLCIGRTVMKIGSAGSSPGARSGWALTSRSGCSPSSQGGTYGSSAFESRDAQLHQLRRNRDR